MDAHWDRRFPVLALAAIAAGTLGAALIAQFGFGLQPCHLCTVQRMPYAFALIVAVMALTEVHDQRGMGFLLGLLAAIFASNVGFAFFHVGVERHWWESACAERQPLATSASSLLKRLAQGPEGPPCDMVPFDLFGVSMAGMNLIVSAVLALFASAAARRVWRQNWK